MSICIVYHWPEISAEIEGKDVISGFVPSIKGRSEHWQECRIACDTSACESWTAGSPISPWWVGRKNGPSPWTVLAVLRQDLCFATICCCISCFATWYVTCKMCHLQFALWNLLLLLCHLMGHGWNKSKAKVQKEEEVIGTPALTWCCQVLSLGCIVAWSPSCSHPVTHLEMIRLREKQGGTS